MGWWLIIIAPDRPDLWTTWAAFYGGAEKVEVRFDRRQPQFGTGRRDREDRRARSPRDSGLQERGYLVIRRPAMAGASR